MKNLFEKQTLMITLAFALLSLGLVSEHANAQSTDRFTLTYEQLGDADNVSTSSVRTRLGHQLFLDEEGSNLLTIGLNYSDVSVTDSSVSGAGNSRSLKTLVPEANLMRVLNEEYSLIVTVRPGFYGDFEDGMENSFRLEGGAVVTKILTDSLTMGLGLGRGTNFGRDLVVPLVQFLYFASDKVLVRGVLPVRASIWYIPDQKWEYGAVFNLRGSLYDIDTEGLQDIEQLGFASANIGGSIRRNIFEKSFLVLEAGISMLRRYEFTNTSGPAFVTGNEPKIENDLGTAPYISIGWQHRL